MTKRKSVRAHAKENGLAIVGIDMDMTFVEAPQGITKIGKVRAKTALSARAAQNVFDAYASGNEGKLMPVEDMLFSVLDGCKGPHEIVEQTGMPKEEAEKIYNWYKDVPLEMIRR